MDNIYLILKPVTEALSTVGKTSLDQTAAQTLANNSTPARGDGGGGKIRRAGPRPRDPPPSPCLVSDFSTGGSQSIALPPPTGMGREIRDKWTK